MGGSSERSAVADKKERQRERQRRRIQIIDSVPRLPPVDSVPMCDYRESMLSRLCHSEQPSCFSAVSRSPPQDSEDTVGTISGSDLQANTHHLGCGAEESPQYTAIRRLRRKLRLKNGFLGTRRPYANLFYRLGSDSDTDGQRPLLTIASKYDIYHRLHEHSEDDSDSDGDGSEPPHDQYPQCMSGVPS